MTFSLSPHFYQVDRQEIIAKIGAVALIQSLEKMFLIRHFEQRAEAAYQMGKIGGFFHSYIGQEAIQTAAVLAMGPNNWYAASYRCHALALLLGEPPQELMAELFGRATGNAKGRGGSMHLFTDRLLGGFGIVAGQVPIATGAAFALKYKEIKNEASICFLGDGAVVQGAFHESLNLASLWNLPCIYVIENNNWGMGTSVEKAVSVPRLAEDKAPGYNMKGYTFDGTDFFSCYGGFLHCYTQVLETGRPLLIEAKAPRFKGHSVSDPGLYRSKDELKKEMERDPIELLKNALLKAGIITEEKIKMMEKEMKRKVMAALEFADKSSWPDIQTLEEDVFALNVDK